MARTTISVSDFAKTVARKLRWQESDYSRRATENKRAGKHLAASIDRATAYAFSIARSLVLIAEQEYIKEKLESIPTPRH